MNFDVYCDESHTDLFASKSSSAKFLVIGSLWLRRESRDDFKRQIRQLRRTHNIRGSEVKWQKVCPNKLAFYVDLIDWFFSQNSAIRFRCIAVDRQHVDLLKFHKSDQELAFYKFYYQMLHRWILDFNGYRIFCDAKSNKQKDRLPVLRECLDNANLSASVHSVQAILSQGSVLLQLADLLTGAVSAKLNESVQTNQAKATFIDRLEQRLGRPIAHTWANEQKFNVFVINLQGGW